MVLFKKQFLMVLYKGYCFFLWAGDSRLYRLRNNELVRMTVDHSQVENYIASGLITRAQASSHPEGNVITRAIGATSKLFLEMDIQKIEVGDRYLLCSDGLTRHLSDPEFQELVGNGDVKEVCENLINLTLERGAGDNVTAILVEVDLA